MIHVDSVQRPPAISSKLIERAASAALGRAAVKADMTVVLTDDSKLRELNRTYLGVDAPTDVLSFSAAETDPDSGASYLGDVLISVPRARSQAEAAGHPLEAEVQLLVVHGTLHLLGYDHADAHSKARMWTAQAEILSSIGLPDIVIRES
jgi:probable rRNA maturation factor